MVTEEVFMRKFLSVFLVLTVIVGFASMPINASETKIEISECISAGFITGAGTKSENLIDGDEESVVLMDTSVSEKAVIKLNGSVDISKIRIALRDFPAWKNVEKITIMCGDKTEELYVKYKNHGVLWIEKELDFKKTNILELNIKTSQNKKQVAAISEIELYGYTSDFKDDSMPRELLYEKDFSVKAKSKELGDYNLKYCFDQNSRTTGGLGSLTNGYMVFEFPYPTDVSELKFTCVENGDWAIPKGVEVKTYNENVIYRTKRENPEPIDCGLLEFEKTDKEQVFELSGENYERITHLILEFNDAYISSTKAVWGGFKEIVLSGILHEDAQPTSEIIATELKSNVEILCDMGIIDGEPTEEYMQGMPLRLDMVVSMLKMTDEYDKALSYVGTYNFSDATEENYNILSYVYAYKCFGIVGDGSNRFLPYEPLTAKACYKMILSYLGYSCGKDFTWDNMDEFCYELGIGDMITIESITNRDMCNAIYESFYVPIKGTDTYFIDKLRGEGRINDTAWAKIADKQDRSSPILDGTYEIPDTEDRNGDFSFRYDETEHIMPATSFCYNAPFHYAGLYYGMLPKDNPLSKREEFAAALKRAGGRSLRFPGGTPAHQYLMEGEEYTIELYRKTVDRVGWKGLYNPDDYNNHWYVNVYDFLDFCQEYDVEPVLQTNPSFFVDKDGVVRQAYPYRTVKVTDEGTYTLDTVYDHDRIEEAIEAFERNLDEIVRRGYKVKYWELGNEDNFSNYSTLPLSDPENPLTQDFLQAIAGYARAIKARFPDAHIIVCSGFPYKELMAPEDYANLTAITKHYPYGRWSNPPTGDRTGAADLARSNENNFIGNYSKEKLHKAQENGDLIIDDTETMAWRFENWDPSSLQATFAQAINTAHNWGELVFDSGYTSLNVMHDLGSPFFGSVMYDVYMDVGTRYFRWRTNTPAYTVHMDDIPDIYKFEEAYYFTPASVVFELLGQHVGGRVLANSRSNVDRKISGYASIKDDKVMFTIVNRFNETIPVNIKLENVKVPQQRADAIILQSNYLRAVLESEYNQFAEELEVKGNTGNTDENAIEIEVMPQSITHFSIKVDAID